MPVQSLEDELVSQVGDDFQGLMRRVQAGDSDAVRELTERYGPGVLRAVRRTLPRRMRGKFDSLDFVQDVWASFFVDPPAERRLESPADLARFLAAMARNKVVNGIRQQPEAKDPALRERSLEDEYSSPDKALLGREPTPSQVVGAEDTWENMLGGLPPHHRPIAILARQGLSVEEIAFELHLAMRTVYRVLDDFGGSRP
jgi:RNA polymerase sigma-70 factor (ECF subfamily)